MNSCCNSKWLRRACLAFVLGALVLSACTDTGPPENSSGTLCTAETTPIPSIQGDAYESPLLGSLVTVRGTVTHVVDDSGFYLESVEIPADRISSRALFISDPARSRSARPGQRLELHGRVSELGTARDTLTSLVEISNHTICAEHGNLPLTSADLPLLPAAREALEGMRVSFRQTLTVTDVYNQARGELSFSSNGVLRVPTEVLIPGTEARKLERDNRNHTLVANLSAPDTVIPIGGTTAEATGLMGHDGKRQVLLLDSVRSNLPPLASPLKPAPAGVVRVVNSNLLNFFNGDGKGGGFPNERGARSQEEFIAQSSRTRAAMTQIQPDLLAVQELENDGFGPDSAARSLLALLNETGHEDWAYIAPGSGPIGGDVITVGLFYRQQALEPVGPPRVLDSPEFRGLSRQPLAQLFRDLVSGNTFLVAANHLKSKGRCPDEGENADQEDGQGCWNPARLAAVNAQIPWLEQLASDRGTRHVIILGDMNAWRNEDPIRQFEDSGYIDLVERKAGLPQYSFLYWGQTGTLDYAFASPALAGFVRSAVIWNVNADWPAGMDLPEPWLRASDHDPVIVDLDFSHPATSD